MMKTSQLFRMILPALILGALVGLVACGGASDEPKTLGDAVDQVSGGLEEVKQGGMEVVEKAVAIAKQIEAAPDRAEEILAEHDLDADKWSEMLNNIAKNPALSAAYEEALKK